MQNAPEQSYQWLRRLIPKSFQPVLRGLRKRIQRRRLRLEEPFFSVYPFIQASPARQQNLLRLARIVEHERIAGAVVECGVLDGGTAALMAFATATSGRPVHMFDAWRGLPQSTTEDAAEGKKWVGQVVGSPARVRRCMKLLGISPTRLHFHVGWFRDTFPHANIERIALLHIDCDFYDPTKLCLERWHPNVVAGGFIQFDDYSEFIGCRKAVDEFLTQHTELRLETFGTAGSAYFIRKP